MMIMKRKMMENEENDEAMKRKWKINDNENEEWIV